MSDSYLYLKCAQCGIEKLWYHESTTANDRQREEEIWTLKHYGHEAAVGIKAFQPLPEAPTPTTETTESKEEQE